MSEVLDHRDPYYSSEDYRKAIDDASREASVSGYFEWNGRFVAALLERGLVLRRINCPDRNSDHILAFPMMAPRPTSGGKPFPYPSYILRVRRN